jgi:MSHA biogenesis protein MshI
MSIISWFSNIFSTPKSEHSIGVSLRQQSLNFCLLSDDDENTCKNIPDSGDNYASAINLLHSEYNAQGNCNLILNAKHSQIVQVDKPKVPDNEILDAVKWQIKDLVTISPEDMVLDYFDGPQLTPGTEKINVVCASKNELLSYVELLSKNNVLLKTITTEEFAFTALLPEKNDACIMICQQPGEELNLLIVKQGRLYFQRRLRSMAQLAEKSENELMMGIVDALSLEVQRSIDYFERQLKQSPIQSIEIIVPMKNEAFLANKLAENVSVPVHLFSLPEQYSEQRDYAACFGATMLTMPEVAT